MAVATAIFRSRERSERYELRLSLDLARFSPVQTTLVKISYYNMKKERRIKNEQNEPIRP